MRCFWTIAIFVAIWTVPLSAAGEICLKKTSYKTEGGAVPRYEYESSQIYDAKTRVLEKIYDEINDDGRRRTKSAVKFDERGEREIGRTEYEWDFGADKWRKVGLSRIERTKDGAFVYVSVHGQNGKLNQGRKANRRDGNLSKFHPKKRQMDAKLSNQKTL